MMGGDRGACEVRAGAMPSGEDGLLVEVTTPAAKAALAAEAVLEAPGPGPGLDQEVAPGRGGAGEGTWGDAGEGSWSGGGGKAAVGRIGDSGVCLGGSSGVDAADS